MYRLYIDETGTQDITNTHDDNNQFFSLSGIIMNLGIAGGDATDFMNRIKEEFFLHDPDDPLILHRKDIMQRLGPFSVLKDDEENKKFCKWLERYLTVIQYQMITVVIDKRAMLRQTHWRGKKPISLLYSNYVREICSVVRKK